VTLKFGRRSERREFSIASTARFKDRNGEPQERTEWHRVVAFVRLADNCQRLLSKARQVYVEAV
jgi:single-strand DNA-binding protein